MRNLMIISFVAINLVGREEVMARSPQIAPKKSLHGGKFKIVSWSFPPNSTSGRHTESRAYVVVPLTSGTLQRIVYSKKGRKLNIAKSVVRLKPYVTFERKTGRGVNHELINKGKKRIRILKFYGG